MLRSRSLTRVFLTLTVLTCLLAGAALAAEPLRVCATVPELGSLAEEVGGTEVTVTVFTKGTESPHFTVPKPSFVKALNACHAYTQIGMELEIGWAPPLLESARNAAILPRGAGFIDASEVIPALGVPSGPIDRSMGDIHPGGNPHYLLDPLNGLRVAALLRDRFTALRPEAGEYFAARYADFRQRLGAGLVGEALSRKYDFEKLALLAGHGRLAGFLDSQGDAALLGGWLAAMRPHAGVKAVAEHDAWAYFAARFGLRLIDFLEPIPGVPPTTSHIGAVIEKMRAEQVGVVLTIAYYDPRYARFVTEKTGAAVVPFAHQVGARPGTDDYLSMMDYNVSQLAAALDAGR
ncbi:MAG: metal ABC transporter substrate-binding protein [Candidatus Tectomicrobia bacterium]|nr:metal ABC transporter substrate-binding protein [Candidatus Tectomicrobia bacterium]